MFPCRLQNFPTRYLGAPLSITRLERAHEQSVVDAVAALIPIWKAGLLNAAGRTTLAKSTLSAIPVHVSICCALSPWALHQIDKKRCAFIWAGIDSVAGGKCKVAWPVVWSPKDIGGLGMPDLRILGFPLRLHWEWLRPTQPDAAWAMLPSKPERAIDAMFRASVSYQVGDGAPISFWTDA